VIPRKYLPCVLNISYLMTDEFTSGVSLKYYFALFGFWCQTLLSLCNCCNFCLAEPRVTRKTGIAVLIAHEYSCSNLLFAYFPSQKENVQALSMAVLCVCVCVCVCVFVYSAFKLLNLLTNFHGTSYGYYGTGMPPPPLPSVELFCYQ
jgi:hypothetical protein